MASPNEAPDSCSASATAHACQFTFCLGLCLEFTSTTRKLNLVKCIPDSVQHSLAERGAGQLLRLGHRPRLEALLVAVHVALQPRLQVILQLRDALLRWM